MAANLTLWPLAWQPISPYVPEHGGKSHLTAQNMAANLTRRPQIWRPILPDGPEHVSQSHLAAKVHLTSPKTEANLT